MVASEAAARAGYTGTPQRNIASAPRAYTEVAVDLAAAATQLRAIAGGLRLAGPTPEAIGDADRIVTGCGALLRELRRAVQE